MFALWICFVKKKKSSSCFLRFSFNLPPLSAFISVKKDLKVSHRCNLSPQKRFSEPATTAELRMLKNIYRNYVRTLVMQPSHLYFIVYI